LAGKRGDIASKRVLLKDFGHYSSTAVSEMILLISEVVTEKILGEITKCHLWSTMVDDPSDIPHFNSTFHLFDMY